MYSHRCGVQLPVRVCVSGNCRLICHHRFSTVLVWAPVVGSTKLCEWLTVRCWNPSAPKLSYRPSNNLWWSWNPALRVLGLMKGSSVWRSLLFSGRATKKISRVSRQIPPRTHWPSINLPLWYFLLLNLLKFRWFPRSSRHRRSFRPWLTYTLLTMCTPPGQ